MTPAKFLLDTNILIPVEDPQQTPETYATLLRDLQQRGHSVFVHEATIADIRRDRNNDRRKVTLSKAAKYPHIKDSWRSRADLSASFGEIKDENDFCDCRLLAAVSDGAADFLISEDAGLHSRARRRGLEQKVLYVRQALELINEEYARADYTLNSVRRKFCYELSLGDPIFESLRQDYDFDTWFEGCRRKHRECWVVEDSQSIAALVIFKDEPAAEAPSEILGRRILKLCTFKVAERYRGGRLGEQLLRQAMCFAFDAGYDTVYLTAFPKQLGLRELIRFYGFRKVARQPNGELIYAKTWQRDAKVNAGNLLAVRRSYPRLPDHFSASVLVPVKPSYHDRLFPEASARMRNVTGDLFQMAWSQGSAERSSPSNSIRKAYLAYPRLQNVEPGTLVAFYRSQDARLGISSGVTAVGIAESYEGAADYQEAIASIAKRSVYKNEEIEAMTRRPGLKILKFIFYGYLAEPIPLSTLVSERIIGGPPQSFAGVRGAAMRRLLDRVRADLVAA